MGTEVPKTPSIILSANNLRFSEVEQALFSQKVDKVANSPVLGKVAETWNSSMKRAASLLVVGPGTAYFGEIWGELTAKATHKIFGTFDYDINVASDSQKIAYREEFSRLFGEYLHHSKGIPEQDTVRENFRRGMFIYGGLLSNPASQAVREQAETLLRSVIVLLWSAFETLSGDLWVQALNANPKKFTIKDVKGGQQITLGNMAEVTDGSFELHNRMGDLMLVANKVSFQVLDKIIEAYERAIPEPTRFTAIFRSDEIVALNKIRNLIVHRNLIVDQKYIDDCAGNSVAPAGVLKTPLFIDGPLVGSLLTATNNAGDELIDLMDAVLLG